MGAPDEAGGEGRGREEGVAEIDGRADSGTEARWSGKVGGIACKERGNEEW